MSTKKNDSKKRIALSLVVAVLGIGALTGGSIAIARAIKSNDSSSDTTKLNSINGIDKIVFNSTETKTTGSVAEVKETTYHYEATLNPVDLTTKLTWTLDEAKFTVVVSDDTLSADITVLGAFDGTEKLVIASGDITKSVDVEYTNATTVSVHVYYYEDGTTTLLSSNIIQGKVGDKIQLSTLKIEIKDHVYVSDTVNATEYTILSTENSISLYYKDSTKLTYTTKIYTSTTGDVDEGYSVADTKSYTISGSSISSILALVDEDYANTLSSYTYSSSRSNISSTDLTCNLYYYKTSTPIETTYTMALKVYIDDTLNDDKSIQLAKGYTVDLSQYKNITTTASGDWDESQYSFSSMTLDGVTKTGTETFSMEGDHALVVKFVSK